MLLSKYSFTKAYLVTNERLVHTLCLIQCKACKYDYKSDTWMLGCVLYELCTLRRPFEGDSLNVSSG